MDFFAGHPLPENVRPSLQFGMRLFLSADIVGSTAYKQREVQSSRWFNMVMGFYREAEIQFMRIWEARASRETNAETRTWLFGERPPELWKTIGDEVVYSWSVQHPWQVVACLAVWKEMLLQLRAYLRKGDRSLDVKSTAWIADFPLRNREIALRTGPAPHAEPEDPAIANELRLQQLLRGAHGIVRDFVGPSIDTGFRLGQAASPRRLVLSVELAHVLSGVFVGTPGARPPSSPGVTYEKPVFYYEGAQVLKGVLGGVPYPTLWIDCDEDSELHIAEDDLIDRKRVDPVTMHRYTSAFISEMPERFCHGLAFRIGAEPSSYQRYCADQAAQIAQEQERRQTAETTEEIKRSAGPAREAEHTGQSLEIEIPVSLMRALFPDHLPPVDGGIRRD